MAWRTAHEPQDTHPRSLFSLVFSVLPDGVTILTFYLLLLYLIPSNRSIGALGSAGAVPIVWGCAAALWWAWYQLQRPRTEAHWGVRPVRLIAFVLVGAFLLSYIAAMIRPLPVEEASPADTGLIRLAGLVGILLVASDGPPGLARFMTFLRRLSFAGGMYAGFGLFQFITDRAWIDLIDIPGLITNSGYDGVVTRGGFARPVSTATHPLEYALVLSMLFPVALSLAFYDKKRPFLWRWTPPALIALALMLSSSRSAYVGLIAGLVVLFPLLTRRARWGLAAGTVGMLGVGYLLAPRVITNLRYLFLTVGSDDSAASRTASYELVADLVSRSPIVGRGFGTFLPQYRILDNQILQLLIEVGILGLSAFILLLATAVICAIVGRHRFSDPLMRGIGAGLAASVVAGASLLALFDAFSFAQAVGTLFLVVGLCSAYLRLCPPRREHNESIT
ncbi:MAG TPA: O-antigen ligase family protein [Homoserinimonas sp.]|nr:O-antigen ligase family protein [Homoserinimonas sp.]